MRKLFSINRSLHLWACALLIVCLLLGFAGSASAQENDPTPQPAAEEQQAPPEPGNPPDPDPTAPPDVPFEITPEAEDVILQAPMPADAPLQLTNINVRYVSSSGGSDSGGCITSPCASLGYAVSQSVAGDMIQISTGTFSPTNVYINKNLTIEGAGMVMTILNGNTAGRVLTLGSGTTVLVKDLTIQNGYADIGGGIWSSGNLTLQRIWLRDNTAYDMAGYGGGLRHSTGTLNMYDVTVSNNHAHRGGGIFIDTSQNVDLDRVTVNSNTSVEYAGGIHLQGSGSFNISNSTISGNSALYAGGLYNSNNEGGPYLINTTIADNTYTSGGHTSSVLNYGSISFINTIISSQSIDSCSGTGSWTTYGHNIDKGVSCHFIHASDMQNTDPILLPLAANGGFVRTHALTSNSPAVDAAEINYFMITDARGRPRPQDGDNDGTPLPDVGAYELDASKTFTSSGTYDGWILESSETSSKGGSKDATASTLRVGDDKYDRQYRSILHFSTSSLPDTAVITSATLKIKRSAYTGTSPFKTHGSLYVDIKKGTFSGSSSLQTGDFQASASKSAAGSIPSTSSSYWHTLKLPSANYTYINKTSSTQMRLRFYKGDNDDRSADYVSFYSGNTSTSSNRPKLIITYYIPAP